MTMFETSSKDLVNLFNKYDIEFVEDIEGDNLIVQWKEKEDSIGGYSALYIYSGFLFCEAIYQLADNITDRNELLHTLISPSDFCFFNSWALDENNILGVNSALPVGFGVSEATVLSFIAIFFHALLDMEGKLEKLGIDFDNMYEEKYDNYVSED